MFNIVQKKRKSLKILRDNCYWSTITEYKFIPRHKTAVTKLRA